MKNPEIKFSSVEENPSYTDPKEIAKARGELLALDTEGKLTIAPNQKYKGELDMWKIQLFETREELDGQTPYDYFDKIIIGHGEGPADTEKRTFKGAEYLGDEFQGTVGDIKRQVAKSGEKILVVVCGTDEENKITLTKAIQEYLSK